MTTPTSLPPPAFKHAFDPGEIVTEAYWGRFENYLPRREGEADTAYADRLTRCGLAVKLVSEEAHDFLTFRAKLADAAERGLPIAMITAVVPDPIRNVTDHTTNERAKAAALAAARAAP